MQVRIQKHLAIRAGHIQRGIFYPRSVHGMGNEVRTYMPMMKHFLKMCQVGTYLHVIYDFIYVIEM